MAPPPLPPPQSDVAAIRALRNESNAGLAARDVKRVAAMFAADIHSIAGGGALTEGREAVTQAYAGDLGPGGDFVRGLRTPGKITVDGAGAQASEPGRWLWTIKTSVGGAPYSGDYLAGWRKQSGRWWLQSELYVTTGCRGPGCPL